MTGRLAAGALPAAPLLELRQVCRTYRVGGHDVRAVDNVSLVIRQGEQVVIEGVSGSGKSTLLSLMGLLDHPTSGAVLFEGQDAGTLTPAARATLRSRSIGYVFQQFHLLPYLNALQNVELGLAYQHVEPGESQSRARQSLAQVGLAHRCSHRPAQLSGGERQRVALARALVADPALLLADEPTGSLDSANGDRVLALLRGLAAQSGCTLVVITHERRLARTFERSVRIQDGKVLADGEPDARGRHVA